MVNNILSIAGTDPSGGAGMQADLKTFSVMKTYGMSVVTAVVAQNTCGVRNFVAMEPQFVADQIDAVFEDIRVDAVKIGMVANAAIAEVIVERLFHHRAQNIVLDPVMVAKSGDLLLDTDAIALIRDVMVPMAAIITPNLAEAEVLLNIKPNWSREQMHIHAPELLELGCRSALLKGGNLKNMMATDIFCDRNGIKVLEARRIPTCNDHGTGCTLSAAITALLPVLSLEESVQYAKDYMTGALRTAVQLNVGHGHGPVHHFHELWK